MKWASLLVCALGGALAWVTGCNSLAVTADVALETAQAVGSVRVVDGSQHDVGVSLAAMLKARGLEATVQSTGSDVVVQGKTAGGQLFALVLHRAPSESGKERTQVALTWMNAQDNDVHVKIMADVDKQPGAKK